MKIEVLENEKETLKIEVHDNTTLLSVINENLWQQKGIDMAAFKVDHPYLSKPILIVKSKNPKKALLDATEQVIDDVKDLRKKFQAEIK
ncbi:MAG: RpoL/Rpb11 RNA polymerase subunit family protein [Candidatus Aenigmatarchaeota archaeon]